MDVCEKNLFISINQTNSDMLSTITPRTQNVHANRAGTRFGYFLWDNILSKLLNSDSGLTEGIE